MKLNKNSHNFIASMMFSLATMGLSSLCLSSLSSCSTPKDVTYFQDASLLNGMAVQAEQQLKLRPEDKVNIVVNSSNPMLEKQFTLTANNTSNVLGSAVQPKTVAGKTTSGYTQMVAYTVDGPLLIHSVCYHLGSIHCG